VEKETKDLFGVAQHASQSKTVELNPDDPFLMEAKVGDIFKVVHIVGGGGGHQLIVTALEFTFQKVKKVMESKPKLVPD